MHDPCRAGHTATSARGHLRGSLRNASIRPVAPRRTAPGRQVRPAGGWCSLDRCFPSMDRHGALRTGQEMSGAPGAPMGRRRPTPPGSTSPVLTPVRPVFSPRQPVDRRPDALWPTPLPFFLHTAAFLRTRASRPSVTLWGCVLFSGCRSGVADRAGARCAFVSRTWGSLSEGSVRSDAGLRVAWA